MHGIICCSGLYEYKGVEIHVNGIGGPMVLSKAGEPYERYPRAIKNVVDEFWGMPREEWPKFRAGGGCHSF